MISVGIPVFRGSNSLIELTEPIIHTLNKSAYDHEIIIVEASAAW